MARSTVQYKFKSQTAVHTVQFDGPSIRVLDLKAEIIRTHGINKDMWAKSDLEISNAQTSEVFAPDSSVGRNVAVLVRRVPAQRRAPITSKIVERELSLDGDGRDEGSPPPGSAGGPSLAGAPAAPPLEEETRAVARTAGRYASKLICPLTGRLFEDAVITTCCGTSFSQGALQDALRMRGACPECNTAAASVRTIPNRLLREAVAAARRKDGEESAAEPPAVATTAGGAPAVSTTPPAPPTRPPPDESAVVVKVEGGERKRPREEA